VSLALVLDYASWFLLVGGAVFCVIGGVGILRLPEFYARTHAATITDTLGAGMMLTGLMLQSSDWIVIVKLVMVLGLLLVTSPTSGHALVKAAAAMGVRWPPPEVSKEDSP
jgi:multicomponent Na+:H+ antiporter subunit G